MSAPKTGLVLTTPGGTRYWVPCPDAETGLRDMEQAAFVYGAAWTDERTTVDFGTDDGKQFTPSKRMRGPEKPT